MAYTIQNGDTLSKIATANKTTVADLMKSNPTIKDANKISAGASLNLPGTSTMGVQATSPYNVAPTTIKPLTPAMTLPQMASANSQSSTPMTVPSAKPASTPYFVNPSQATSAPNNLYSTQKPMEFPMTPGATLNGNMGGIQGSGKVVAPAPTNTSTYSGDSIVDYLTSVKQPSDFNTRATLAKQYGIANYTGSAEQNTQLLNMMRGGQNNASTATTSAPATSTPQRDYSYTPPTTTGSQDMTNTAGITQAGLIQQLLDKGSATSADIANLKKSLAEKIGGEYIAPGFESYQTGRAGIISKVGAEQEQALQDKLANERGLLGTAISATAPQMQFGQLTNPLTGAPVSGGAYGNNPQLQTAVAQAIQLVQNGVSPYDSSVQNLLSTFGLPGQSLFTQSMQQLSNGTYNPQLIGANVQNSITKNIDTKNTLSDQSIAIEQASQNLKGIGEQGIDLITKAGLNTKSSNWANEKMNSYITSQNNPSAYASLTAVNNEVQKFLTTLVSANTGQTPTAISGMLAPLDVSNMTANDLKLFLDNIQALAMKQKGVAQEGIDKVNSSGANLYSGSSANGNTSMNGGSNDPMNAVGSLLIKAGVTSGTILGGLEIGGSNLVKTGVGYLGKVFGR